MAISKNLAGPRAIELQKLADYGSKNGFPVSEGPGLGKQLTQVKNTAVKNFPGPADSYSPSGERSDGVKLDLSMFETARKMFGR